MADLEYDKRDNYAIFTMNRPDRLNALGGAMMGELESALLDFNNDPKMRVGILTGAGDRAFCAGADLKEMAQRNSSPTPRLTTRSLGMLGMLSNSPKPFIGAVNGLAIGGGMEFSMDCDIRICVPEAYFGLFEVKRGIMAGYGIHHLHRLIPQGGAMYVLLTGDRLSSEQAYRYGFVHEIVPREKLLSRAEEIAALVCDNAPLSVQGTKAVAQFWRQYGIEESFRLSEWVGKVVLSSEDAKEGPKAFTEKRAPQWKGR
ncbi:MAG: enoyl-CoA hydratase [Dehalococcoidia bacterium]|nr:enoyl-CoA hydratase [Dehalococcoidia bacterium]